MNQIPYKKRWIHFVGNIAYFLFFCAIYTLPAINLKSIATGKDFVIAFIFPLMVLILSVKRLLSAPYPLSLIMMMISKGKFVGYEGRNAIDVWVANFFNVLFFLLPVTLISFKLDKTGLYRSSYSPLLFWASAAISLAAFITTIVLFLSFAKGVDVGKIVVGIILATLRAGFAWWIGSEASVIYEMVYLHPELFRI